ncbi:hypothetical protein E2C01_064474 [Portunus trituberculatus]|uniref:Uncharacterized protein n=1 Tax=Portunus trituberculatus TaxID=210409 RepID=A0A5B7HG93_PORTR|nr:hypothetical protein [Portunus trituberculatus]
MCLSIERAKGITIYNTFTYFSTNDHRTLSSSQHCASFIRSNNLSKSGIQYRFTIARTADRVSQPAVPRQTWTSHINLECNAQHNNRGTKSPLQSHPHREAKPSQSLTDPPPGKDLRTMYYPK